MASHDARETAVKRDLARWDRPVFAFNDLDEFFGRHATDSGVYSVPVGDCHCDFLVENRGAATTIVIFHSALVDRNDVSLPYFQGQRLAGDGANAILVSDPGLHARADLTIGWFAGTSHCPAQKILPGMLNHLNTGMSAERCIFTGASAGGFAALFYAHAIPGSLCVVVAPQTALARFYQAYVRDYCAACFCAADDGAMEEVLERKICSDVARTYAGGFETSIVYLLNRSDTLHLEEHAKPFFSALHHDDRAKTALVLGDWGEGHVPVPGPSWRRLLQEAVAQPGDWSRFVADADFSYIGTKHHAPAAWPN